MGHCKCPLILQAYNVLCVPTMVLQASTCPPTEARCRHVSPRLLRTVTEAPAALSMWHISALPASAAKCSAVSPHSFLALSRARNCLVCRRRWTTSALPSRTAENRSKVVIFDFATSAQSSGYMSSSSSAASSAVYSAESAVSVCACAISDPRWLSLGFLYNIIPRTQRLYT